MQRPAYRLPALILLRVVLPLLAALVVFWTGYVATTQRHYDTANALSGEIVEGGSVGQTFIAHYNDLSGVQIQIGTYGHEADPTRGPFVLHLRTDPTSTTDLATATIPPSQVLEKDTLYTFSFPPIEGSQYKSYYLLVDSPGGVAGKSMSVLWYQPLLRGDPYANGAAYKDGVKTGGDLAFALFYSASPIEVWTTMLGDAGANTSPILLYALLLLALLAIIGAIARPYIKRTIEWLRRRKIGSLAGILFVGLIYGLLFIVITPPWQGPDEYTHFAYVALLDKHNLDDAEVQALDLAGKDRDYDLIRAVNASADRNDFTRRLLGTGAPGAPTRTDAYLFQQIRQPATYYWLGALALRAARAIGIDDDPYTQPEAAIYVMRLVSLVLALLVIVLAWFFATRLLPAKKATSGADNKRPKIQNAAILLALLPMHIYVATSINNDILAEVAVSALFVALAALYATSFGACTDQGTSRPDAHRKEAALIVLCVLLAVAGVETKATAFAASFPLLSSGLLVWAAIRLYRKYKSSSASTSSVSRQSVLKPAAVTIGALLLAVGAFFAVCGPDSTHALGWVTTYTPLQRVERVESSSAHNGAYVIQLNTASSSSAIQKVIPQLIFHSALRITFAGWARIAPQQNVTGSLTAQLIIDDGTREAGVITSTLSPSGDWTRMELTADVEQNAEQVLLRIASRDAAGVNANVQFDDMAIRVEGITVPWNDPIYKPALLDPSGENAPWTVRAPFSSLLPSDIRDMVDALLNPQPFSKPALWQAYTSTQYNSFWGDFGWLSIILPSPFFVIIGAVLLLALLGLFLRLIRSRHTAQGTGWPIAYAIVSLFAVVVAIFASFAKQMALTAYGGLPSDPQGRYLFVLAIPVAWLIIAGLNNLAKGLPSIVASTARFIAASALVFFASYALLALIVPYYYG